MKKLHIISIAAANAAVFGLYLLFIHMVENNESILPAMIIPTLIFIGVIVLCRVGLVHILPAYAAVIGYAVWGGLSGRFGLSAPMLTVFTILFAVLQLTALLLSGIVKSGIRSIREEISEDEER